MSLFDRAVNYLRGLGWTDNQARGIAGNLAHESGGFNTNAVGDGGRAYGLAQWHPDRQANFRRVIGRDIRGSSFEQQLSFVNWELNNTESRAGNALRSTNTVADATRVFMQLFERPANNSSLGARISAAANGAIDSIGTTLNDTIGFNNPLAPSNLLGSVFTTEIAGRTVAVVIGVILVTLAIAAFILTSDTGQAAVKVASRGLV